MVIGARHFLIAYNVNLNTGTRKSQGKSPLPSAKRADQRDDRGNHARRDGEPLRIPGKFEVVKAVGWYMESFGRAQVSINLTDHHKRRCTLCSKNAAGLPKN